MSMVVMIDNFDSFTYNLVQYLMVLHSDVVVFRNNGITIDQLEKLKPEMIVISPGPCTPNEAGVSLEIVHHFKDKVPILGICLGHQVIGQAFGAHVVRAIQPVHGKVHPIRHEGKGVFAGLRNPLMVTRYHSLVLEPTPLPDELEVTAVTKDGEIMGIRHKSLPVEGVQFHPEAILTEMGMELLDNFLTMARSYKAGKNAV
jgi:para-aminobenzoate synthetase component II